MTIERKEVVEQMIESLEAIAADLRRMVLSDYDPEDIAFHCGVYQHFSFANGVTAWCREHCGKSDACEDCEIGRWAIGNDQL